jgi:curved DNA-binding protein
MDYYNILGVNRNASTGEIKKAYKRASMQHHPDRGGNSDEFIKVQQAYDTLSDNHKRQAYDNPHPQGFGPNGFQGMGGFEEAMRQANAQYGNMFGQGFQQPRQTPRNRDITLQADITLEDVMKGKNLIIQYQLSTKEIATVTVDVPPGAKHGDTIQYEGLGDNGHPRYPRGNLHVKIRVIKSKQWVRDGDNLITKTDVNIFDLLLGCVIIITTIDKRQLELTIPQGTKIGAKFSIPGYGLPNMQTRNRGIMYITIEAEMPKITDQSLLDRIGQIKQDIIRGPKG